MVLSRGGYFISTSMMDKFLWQIMRFLSRLVNFFFVQKPTATIGAENAGGKSALS